MIIYKTDAEVAIMKELDDHPGFIHVKEVYEDNTNLILVEDLVTGKPRSVNLYYWIINSFISLKYYHN